MRMNVVACYKCVRDDQDIKVDSKGGLDFSQAAWKVGSYDLNGIEAGMRLVESEGGSAVVLTAAAAAATDSKMKKAALSRGPEQLYCIQDEALVEADSFATASALAAGVRALSDTDLVLCGEGSGDVYSQQVGPLLGYLLGWNTVNGVSSIKAGNGCVVVERDLGASVETLEVPLPAVVSVTSDINTPRIAGMKDILAAGKKPCTVWTLEDVQASVENRTTVESIVAPEQKERAQQVLEGDSDETVAQFFELMRKAL